MGCHDRLAFGQRACPPCSAQQFPAVPPFPRGVIPGRGFPRIGGGFAAWRSQSQSAGHRCLGNGADWPACAVRSDLGKLIPGGGVHQSQPALDGSQQTVAGVEELEVVDREQACFVKHVRAPQVYWRPAKRRFPRACFSCSICTRNSISTMPPGPRFRSPAEAVSSSRCRIWRIVDGVFASPAVGEGGLGHGSHAQSWRRVREP